MTRLLPFVLVLVAACSGSSDDSGPDEVTFTKINEEVLVKSCALSSCHGPGEEGATESGLTIDLSDADANYNALVNATAETGNVLVVPGDVDGSFLVTKIIGEQASGEGDPMPPPFGLDAQTAAMVVSWVEAGAPNN